MEGSWHLTSDKFLALNIYNFHSNYVFSVTSGAFLGKFNNIFAWLFFIFNIHLKVGGVDLKNEAGREGP